MYKAPRPEPKGIPVSDARRAFAEIVNRVAYGNERVTVVRHGREVVAIVPISDLRRLEASQPAPGQTIAPVNAPTAAEKRLPRPRTGPRP
jgi:prevent-host-death family protein